MYFLSDNELKNIKNLLGLEINAYEKMLSIYDNVILLVNENNGKRADKRFIDKLQSIYKGLNIKKDFDFNNNPLDIDFIYYVDNRCIKAVNGEHYIYIKNDCFYMSNNHDYKTYKEGKINAVEIVANLEKQKKYYTEKVANLKEQAKRLKTIYLKWWSLIGKAGDFRGSIDYSIAQYLKMYEDNL